MFGVSGLGFQEHNLCVGLEEREGSGSRSWSYRQGKHISSSSVSVTGSVSTGSISYKLRMELLPKGGINKLGLIDCELSEACLRTHKANEKEF